MLALSISGPALAAGDVTAFCRSHPDMDDPGPVYFGPDYQPGPLPEQVQATDATDWRCMEGAALLCDPHGAAGPAWLHGGRVGADDGPRRRRHSTAGRGIGDRSALGVVAAQLGRELKVGA
jgi:hypothetical protein